MTCKMKMINKIAAKVTVKTRLNIEVHCNYEAINEIMQILYAKTMTLLVPQKGGNHGHISLIM